MDDPYQIMLEAILAVELVLLLAFVVLRIVFPPIPPFELNKENRELIERQNREKNSSN